MKPTPFACPPCAMDNICTDDGHYICAHCAHDWPAAGASTAADADAATAIVRDANGNTFAGGRTAAGGEAPTLDGLSMAFNMSRAVKPVRLAGGGHAAIGKMEACGWFRAQRVLPEATMNGMRS
ncbi:MULTISPECIES: hypothetical protein [Burkholderia]|uniref:hypothetical protein n=1 Tax=Burkholderia TaxID=32008 RepID=UPI000858DBFA|nr:MULTISPECIES: hypothetical protein [unclassified Burkholderia]AOK28131.1 hypothetical protein AQ611_00495 [Burkholderia sp. Bp7605]